MSTIRLAIVGTQGHYENVLRELAECPGAQLVAVAAGGPGDDLHPILSRCRHRRPAVFADYVELLDRCADLDVLVVCGPFERQAEMSADAIERGVHVLVEKPAALTRPDLDRLRAACARRPDVHLAGMMFSRYSPGFYTAWQLIRGGAIGDVRLVDARKSYKLGRRQPYFHARQTYGGTIPWVGSHAIDWVMWLTGGRMPTSVYATHSIAHNDGNGSMERAAQCHFTLPHGRTASVSIDLFRPEHAPSHGDDWARVVGTSGVIEVRPGSVHLINAENDGSMSVEVGCDRRLLPDFLAHAHAAGGGGGGAKAMIDRESTLALAEVCLAARRSADDGRVLHIGTRTPAEELERQRCHTASSEGS